MSAIDLKGSWVWVTGASQGLGKEIARQLAVERGANVVVTARRADRLEALKAELEAKAGVQVRIVAADLSRSDDVGRVTEEMKHLIPAGLSGVVLNAALQHFGHHHELSWAELEAMLHTNVVSSARITHELLLHHKGPRPLHIQLVGSLQGVVPIPYQSAYSGTKGFLFNFAMALAGELGDGPVRVQLFAPTGVQTEWTAGERYRELAGFLLPVEKIARKAIEQLRTGKILVTPMGPLERLGLTVERLFPRRVAVNFMGMMYRRSLLAATAREAARATTPQAPK